MTGTEQAPEQGGRVIENSAPGEVVQGAAQTERRGRMFGKNVLEGVFRAAPQEDLFLGELLVAADAERDRRYFYRVVDVEYGSEHREPGWAERVAGTLLNDDAVGDTGAHPLHDVERRTYRVANCRCLGYVTPRGEFRKPKSLVTQFSQVTTPSIIDFEFLARQMGDLKVARLRSGEAELDFDVGIRGASLTSHVGVFATTGMGKSNLMKVLAGEVMQAGGRYGLLIIDPHGEYRQGAGGTTRGLVDHPWAEEGLRVYSARSLPQATQLRLSLADLDIDDLRTAYDWSNPQLEALDTLARHYRTNDLRWLAEFVRIDDLITFRDVDLPNRAVAPATLQVLQRRARVIVSLDCITADPGVGIAGRLLDDLRSGKVVLVDASGLGSMEELLVASYLARRVMEDWQRAYLEDRDTHERLPSVGIVLEEAQRVLSKGSQRRDANVFSRIAREGRKFKVGLCAVTQQPKLIDDELLSQFNTFFILGLADERDRNILKGSSKQDLSALGAEIQTLMPGECLLANLDTPFAVPAKIYYYEERLADVPSPPQRPQAARPNVAALVD